MKKKSFIIFGILFIMGMMFSSCEKEELFQPRFAKHEFFPQGRDYVVDKFYPYADSERDGSHPESYDAITDTSYNRFVIIFEENILLELDILTEAVNHEFRYGSDKNSPSEAYDKIKAGFHPDFYAFCPGVCEDLHVLIRHYVVGVVNGDPEWTNGTANEYHRQEILNFLNTVDPDNTWDMTYGDIVKNKIKEYVVDGIKPDNNRDGWFFFHSS